MNPVHARMIARLVRTNRSLEDENEQLRMVLQHIVNRCIEESVDDIFEEDEVILNFADFAKSRGDDELMEMFEVEDHPIEGMTFNIDDIMPTTDRFRRLGGEWGDILENN